MADKDALIQVIINLLSNALKFSDPQKPGIGIKVSKEDKYLRLAISDNGPGIDEKDHELIFDKFFQVSDRPAGTSPGSGLGLAITKKIIELHGGKIRVKNNSRKGVSFIFNIPFNPTSL